jgi:dephospho-CoA kinase
MDNIVIAAVGMCGTGKSVVTQYIEKNYKFKSIYFGGFILEEVKRRGLEINSTNEKTVREDLRKKNGLDAVAKLAVDRINAYLADGENVIIDGLYSFSEYVFLKEKLKNPIVLIAVHSTKQLRYERLGIREIRPLTPQQVDERDLVEIKNIEKAGPIAIADFHIINDGNFRDLYQYIDSILNEIIK